MIKTCKQCGKKFETHRDEAKFCSKECFRKYKGHNTWTKRKIKKELKETAKKIGHSPSERELREIGRDDLVGVCKRYFGTFNEAKKQVGMEVFRTNKWNKKKVKKELLEVTEKLGHSPTVKELGDIDRYDLLNACRRYFGGFNKAKKEVGLEIYYKDWNKKKIIKELKEIAKEKGHSPSQTELYERGKGGLVQTCYSCFGSFNEAKKEAGLETYKKGNISKRHQIKPTKPEQRIINVCKEYNLPFKYVGDGKFIVHGLNPDFINCNGKKQIIEVFGRYWHKERENIYWKRTEFGRKAIFSQLGYETLIIWDDEIENMSNKEIAKKIKNFKEVEKNDG